MGLNLKRFVLGFFFSTFAAGKCWGQTTRTFISCMSCEMSVYIFTSAVIQTRPHRNPSASAYQTQVNKAKQKKTGFSYCCFITVQPDFILHTYSKPCTVSMILLSGNNHSFLCISAYLKKTIKPTSSCGWEGAYLSKTKAEMTQV